ncbi:MAG: ABC transporter permease [Clostridia bacterium]|jgi:ABC-2 type transport system permease protein|nr:ABC transporter permease [Clostridia bacterium]MBT7122012.1 ABC transporter permease [Clostridia bacterium]
MKLLSSYIKEMKIAARGFYFYVELGIAIIMLLILLFAIAENPDSKSKEYLFNDLPDAMTDAFVEEDIEEGVARWADDAELTLKPIAFEITNEETGELASYNYDEEKIVTARVLEKVNTQTGALTGTTYILDNEEDMIRLSYAEQAIGATTSLDDTGRLRYKYYLQGYETDRMVDLLYVLHNEDPDVFAASFDSQQVRTLDTFGTLNSRQGLVPLFVAFAGSLMGFFIVMAYIFLDKDEGVIKAFAVTPSSVWKYLLSKTMVIMTTVVVSSSIITIPVMGGQPNYLLFYLFVITTTFAFATLGLLVASFSKSLTQAFGALFVLAIMLMLPAFSYFIPSFDPVWLRFFPTYPVLQGYKEILVVGGNVGYVLMYSGVFLVGGTLLFLLANIKFKKTLTV